MPIGGIASIAEVRFVSSFNFVMYWVAIVGSVATAVFFFVVYM